MHLQWYTKLSLLHKIQIKHIELSIKSQPTKQYQIKSELTSVSQKQTQEDHKTPWFSFPASLQPETLCIQGALLWLSGFASTTSKNPFRLTGSDGEEWEIDCDVALMVVEVLNLVTGGQAV